MIRSLAFALAGAVCALAQTPCESLKTLSLPNTTVTAAEAVAAGPYRAPGQAEAGAPRGLGLQMPAYCRVAAVIKPAPDSDIRIEVWLPAADWNGKFQAVGNGGWAGVISFAAMAQAVVDHYATASTDTGHMGGDASFTLGHPDKVIDFAYRAVHEMTVQSKKIVEAYYGREPRLSYWNGCSTGGRQGLMEAQRYPADFDGIIAGAPANYHLHLHAAQMELETSILKNKEAFLGQAQRALLNQAVMQACDALDGVKDGLLEDPHKCHFDPAALACKDGQTAGCLTAPQIATAKRIYAGARTKEGKLIFPGLEEGGELGWRNIGAGTEPAAISMGSFRYLTFQDPNWDWRTFDLDRDTALADQKAGFIDAVDPDLQPFRDRGGKLLLYHGWSDQGISPENTINYYSEVIEKLGPNEDGPNGGAWIRLFMVPGMQHCGGGPGPNQFNMIGAMERWREEGRAPQQILAEHVTNNRVDMTRPLCPYPQTAQYSGVGSTNDAANFVCKAQ